MNNDNFCRLPVTSAQCIIGTEKNPDAGILLNYDDDDFSKGFSQPKENFRALQKDDTLQPFIPAKFLDFQILWLMNLNELISSQSEVKELQLKDKLGHRNFHENIKDVFETRTATIENTSYDFRKTLILASEESNKVITNLNDKSSKILSDRV